eukprot:COSAG02_NODE_2503_length_8671_cov_20.133108_6_plen_83_part_00
MDWVSQRCATARQPVTATGAGAGAPPACPVPVSSALAAVQWLRGTRGLGCWGRRALWAGATQPAQSLVGLARGQKVAGLRCA